MLHTACEGTKWHAVFPDVLARHRTPYLLPNRQAAMQWSTVRMRCWTSLRPSCGVQTTAYNSSGPGASGFLGSKKKPLLPDAWCKVSKFDSGTRMKTERTSALAGCWFASIMTMPPKRPCVKESRLKCHPPQGKCENDHKADHNSGTQQSRKQGKAWTSWRTGCETKSSQAQSGSHKITENMHTNHFGRANCELRCSLVGFSVHRLIAKLYGHTINDDWFICALL